jgi:N-acetylmuramoyl-L-alanine amidase
MKIRFLLIILTLAFLAGCGLFGKKDYNWTDLPEEYYGIPVYAGFLDGFTIVLDPGHGGQAEIPGYKRGPHGVREAEMNLRVANHLRDFLEQAGVTVIFTRTDDSYISLEDRAEFANTCGADFMVSLHHNASGNPKTNYASVYYHNHPDYSPASIDLARNIYFGLTDALHLPQISMDGLHSDFSIYPAGFGLLRRMQIPSILLESSFYSNFAEEERLTDDDYNKREAYGIFLGLARYAAGGIPSAALTEPKTGFTTEKQPDIVFSVDDGLRERRGPDFKRLRIFTDALSVKLDGAAQPFEFDRETEQIVFQPEVPLENGMHLLEVQLINMYKNNNWPKLDTIIVASPVRFIRVEPVSERYPAYSAGFIPVDLHFLDRDSSAAWDGTEWLVDAKNAAVVLADSVLFDGGQRVYLLPSENGESIVLNISADSVHAQLVINRVQRGMNVLEGEVVSSFNDSLIAGVNIWAADTVLSATGWDGKYFTTQLPQGRHLLHFEKDGFTGLDKEVELLESGVVRADVALAPVDSGIFFNREGVIDARYDRNDAGGNWGNGSGYADVNFDLTTKVLDLLEKAGSSITGIRDSVSENYSVAERVERVNALPGQWYLRIGAVPGTAAGIVCHIYPGSKRGRAISEALLVQFAQLGFTGEVKEGLDVPEVRNTNKSAVALEITTPRAEHDRYAKAIYTALTEFYRQVAREARTAQESEN